MAEDQIRDLFGEIARAAVGIPPAALVLARGHQRRRRTRVRNSMLALTVVVAAGVGTQQLAGLADARPAPGSRISPGTDAGTHDPVRYPAWFAGAAMGGPGGLQIFAALTGRRLRVLTPAKGDQLPDVVPGRRLIYYFDDVPSGGDCGSIMALPYRGGRPAAVLRLAGQVLGAYAVSADGKYLAYSWQPPSHQAGWSCNPVSSGRLTIVNLTTGARHTISGVPPLFGLAWAPSDQALVIDRPAGDMATSEAEVLAHPLTTSRYRAGTPLPCPDRVRGCAEFTPTYDSSGRIVYVAALTPQGAQSRFVLTRLRDGVATGLATSRGAGRGQGGGWSVTDASGSAVIFTMPDGSGWATFRWTAGASLTRLRPTVTEPAW